MPRFVSPPERWTGLRTALELFLVDTLLSHLFLLLHWDGRTALTAGLWLKTFGLYLGLGLLLELLLMRMYGSLSNGIRDLPLREALQDVSGIARGTLLTLLVAVLIGPRLNGPLAGRGALVLAMGVGLTLLLLRRQALLTPRLARWTPGLEVGGLLFMLLGTRVNVHLLGGSPLLPQNLQVNQGLLLACLGVGWAVTGALTDGRVPTSLERFSAQSERLKLWGGLHIVTLLLALKVVPGHSVLPAGDQPQTARRMSSDLNVLLLVVDTLRADRLGAYGYRYAQTPHIDALARESLLFRHHQSSSPWTYPSFGTLLTGFSPGVHLGQVMSQPGGPQRRALLGVHPIRHELPTLATLLQAEGYRTGLIATNPCLDRSLGLGRGFTEHLLALHTGMNYTVLGSALEAQGYRPLDPDETTVDAAPMVDHFLDFIDRDGRGTSRKDAAATDLSSRRPFFLLAHLMDPHWPYRPPERFLTRDLSPEAGRFETPGGDLELSRWSDLYDAEVRYVDEQVGRLLDGLRDRGLLEHTLVILTADHGEAFGEHGSWHDPSDMPDEADPYYSRQTLHGHSLYQELLEIPWVLRLPGQTPGVHTAVTRGVDVMPTVLEALGLPIPAGLEGRSVLREPAEPVQPESAPPASTPASTPTPAPAREATPEPAPEALCSEDPATASASTPPSAPPALSESVLLGEDKFAWRERSFKLIVKPSWPEGQRLELYNLSRDPGETVNLAPLCPELVSSLQARLQSALDQNQTRLGPYTPPAIDPTTQEKLKALGYVN